MKIAIGADHAGLSLKDEIIDVLESEGHEVQDLGAFEFDPDDDYPDFAAPVGRAVSSGQADRGVVLCGSGVGAAIAANKIPGARASVCHDTYTAAQGVEHDNMNVLCLGARVIGPETARAATLAFVRAVMDAHPRFKRRLDKVNALELEAGQAPERGGDRKIMASSAANNIQLAHEAGQSIWLDFINRELLRSGRLAELAGMGLGGLTSNPTIFQGAISQGADYDGDLSRLAADGLDVNGIFEAVALQDIADAADILRPVHDARGRADGFVSLEVNPQLAADTDSTIAEAVRLFQALDRPNVLIKVPATPEGIPAIRALIGRGVNVNVTLIFSLHAYRKVADAYIEGLQDYLAAGNSDLSGVASVASFFVSRVDTAVDNQLPDGSPLRGKAGIANARLAYADYQRIFSEPRFAELKRHGARVQRPLWASTSVKNPAYPELMYVDGLMGPDTVNTLPPATVEAFLDHGNVSQSLTAGVDDARAHMAALAGHGIDMDAVTDQLLEAGVGSFTASFVALMDDIRSKCAALAGAAG